MSDQVLWELVLVLDKSFIQNDLNDLCLSLRDKVQDFDCENVSNSMEPKRTRIIKIINFLSSRGKLQVLLDAAIEINDAYSVEIRDIGRLLPAQESLKTISTNLDDLKAYLEWVKDKEKYKTDLETKSLDEYYVELRARWTSNQSVAVQSDSLDNPEPEDKKIGTIVKDDLLNGTKVYLIIEASFGMGKTTMARMEAARCSEEFFMDNDFTAPVYEKYIPILVDVSKGLNEKLYRENNHDDNLYEILEKIVAPTKDEEKRQKILLILDGLDESESDPASLMDSIIQLRNRYTRMKVMITTRLRDSRLNLPGDLSDRFVMLLRFDKDQVNEFFGKYQIQLSYDYRKKIGLKSGEISIPLFAWMIVKSFFANNQENVVLNEGWTENMRRCFLYMFFFHNIARGKHRSAIKARWSTLYVNEKQILRKIAALNQIYGNKLMLNKVKQEIYTKFQGKDKLSKAELDSILASYCNLKDAAEDLQLDFTHTTFKNYFLAEYYIESLLEHQFYRLNTKIPDEGAISFLDGLIDLLKYSKNKSVGPNERNQQKQIISRLLDGTKFENSVEDAIDDLESSATDCIRQPHMIMLNHTQNVVHMENIWVDIDYTNVGLIDLGVDQERKLIDFFSIHKWISLFILNKLAPGKNKPRQIERMFRASSHLVEPHLKRLQGINLSDTNLSHADLSDADLSYADLSDTNLSHAKLSGANLSQADLSGANLSHANLTACRLCDCIIKPGRAIKHSGADFSGAITNNSYLMKIIGSQQADNVTKGEC